MIFLVSSVESSIDVAVPVTTAYNQWTQFETFPEFMEGVDKVVQLDDTTLEWTAEIMGQTRTWKSAITEQTPDQRIAWRSTGEVDNAGVVTFHRLDDENTRVMLQLEYAPEQTTEKIADAAGVIRRRAERDLERFKKFIESRGSETGAWRGEV